MKAPMLKSITLLLADGTKVVYFGFFTCTVKMSHTPGELRHLEIEAIYGHSRKGEPKKRRKRHGQRTKP